MKVANPRIVSVPDTSRLNTYISNWFQAVGIEPCIHIPRSEYKNTILNRYWIRNNKDSFDIVHFHWKFDRDNLISTILALYELKKCGIKIIWTAHDVFPHDEATVLFSIIIKWFLFRFADRVVVHNHSSEAILQQYFGKDKRIVYINHPDYDVDLYPKRIAKSILSETHFMFLCFGSMKPYKGFQYVIDAFPSEGDDKSLWIVGEMPRNNRASLRVNKNGIILHTGPASKKELEVIVAAADICILPYKWCTASGVLNYLKQYGKPIIVSTARCLESDGYPYGLLRFRTLLDLRDAMISANNIVHENNLKSDRNVNNPDYRGVAQSIYEF